MKDGCIWNWFGIWMTLLNGHRAARKWFMIVWVWSIWYWPSLDLLKQCCCCFLNVFLRSTPGFCWCWLTTCRNSLHWTRCELCMTVSEIHNKSSDILCSTITQCAHDAIFTKWSVPFCIELCLICSLIQYLDGGRLACTHRQNDWCRWFWWRDDVWIIGYCVACFERIFTQTNRPSFQTEKFQFRHHPPHSWIYYSYDEYTMWWHKKKLYQVHFCKRLIPFLTAIPCIDNIFNCVPFFAMRRWIMAQNICYCCWNYGDDDNNIYIFICDKRLISS